LHHLARVVCYSGGRNLDNLVVGDGRPTSVGVSPPQALARYAGKALTRKRLPTSVGVSPSTSIPANLATRKHIPTSVGVSPPYYPTITPQHPTLANTSPLRWGFLLPNGCRCQLRIILAKHTHFGGGFSFPRPMPRWYPPHQAKHTPLRWGFLRQLSSASHHGESPRNHLPTSVGVFLNGRSCQSSRSAHYPLQWASFQPVPILYPTPVGVFALA
jgi:hypothetical protein